MPCRHHWLIAPSNGPTSKGVCRFCGEEREFKNSKEEYGPKRSAAAHTMYSTPGEKLRIAEAYRE